MKGKQKVVLGLVGALGLIAVVFFGMLVATDPGDNLRLVESSLRPGPSGLRYVAGAIQNETNDSYFLVQMDIDFLDAQEKVVGSTVVKKSDLGSGEIWNFEVPILSEIVVRARMKNLTCSVVEGPPDPRACHLPDTVVLLEEV